MRNTSRPSPAAWRSPTASWIATALRTASTTLANSASSPSPISLNTPPIVPGDRGLDDRRTQRREGRERRLLVGPQQPRGADHVGRQNRRQPPRHALSRHASL